METEFVGFERNRYYAGKLLTADDFIIEQKYFLDKRRFVNENLYCGGIVRGLWVEESQAIPGGIRIHAGSAIDYIGREIVLPKDTDRKLEGLDPGKDCAYLCLSYDETPTFLSYSPVPPVGQKQQYNRIIETYKFEWTTSPSSISEELSLADRLRGDVLYWNRGVIYSGEDFIITQSVPRYVRPQSFFEIKIYLLRLNKGKAVSFSYEMEGENITGIGDEIKLNAVFYEGLHTDVREYTLPVNAFASGNIKAKDTLSITPGSFELYVDKELISSEPAVSLWEIERADTDIQHYIRDKYLRWNLPEVLGDIRKVPLYLAQIKYTTKKDPKTNDDIFTVTGIRNVPFGQYLDSWQLNGMLQGILPSLMSRGEMLTEDKVKKLLDECREEYRPGIKRALQKPDMSAGTASVKISYKRHTYGEICAKIEGIIMGKKGDSSITRRELYKYLNMLILCRRRDAGAYAQEKEFLDLFGEQDTFEIKGINHNLGRGQVEITCGVADGKELSVNPPEVELYTLLDMDKGEFTIKGRLLERMDSTELTVAWNAGRTGEAK